MSCKDKKKKLELLIEKSNKFEKKINRSKFSRYIAPFVGVGIGIMTYSIYPDSPFKDIAFCGSLGTVAVYTPSFIIGFKKMKTDYEIRCLTEQIEKEEAELEEVVTRLGEKINTKIIPFREKEIPLLDTTGYITNKDEMKAKMKELDAMFNYNREHLYDCIDGEDMTSNCKTKKLKNHIYKF